MKVYQSTHYRLIVKWEICQFLISCLLIHNMTFASSLFGQFHRKPTIKRNQSHFQWKETQTTMKKKAFNQQNRASAINLIWKLISKANVMNILIGRPISVNVFYANQTTNKFEHVFKTHTHTHRSARTQIKLTWTQLNLNLTTFCFNLLLIALLLYFDRSGHFAKRQHLRIVTYEAPFCFWILCDSLNHTHTNWSLN